MLHLRKCLDDTLATTTIGTAQKVGEGKVQATLAAAELRDATAAQREKSIEMLRIKRAELQAQFDELSSSITNHTVVGMIASTSRCSRMDSTTLSCPSLNVSYPK